VEQLQCAIKKHPRSSRQPFLSMSTFVSHQRKVGKIHLFLTGQINYWDVGEKMQRQIIKKPNI